MPELEAAVREVVALADRDQFAVPGSSDYDYDLLMARGEVVRKRAEAVAAGIFAHQPRTLAGLLVTARAVAATTGELWDAPPVDLEYTDTLLRVLPDKLFALCGVDCRGRPQVHGSPAGSALLGLCEIPPDADLLALGRAFDAAFAAYLPNRPRELAAEAARQAAWDAEPGLTQEAIADDEPGARERWKALCAPFEGAIGEANRLRELADVPAAAAFRLPAPSTMAGLAVLARMLAGYHVELWDGPLAKLEIEGRMLRVTLEAALALAGVDRLGLPAGTPWIAMPAVARSCPDADLAAAAAELDRLDIEIGALSRGERRDLDEIPAYRALEARRMKALRTLRRTKSRTVAGIEAKAHALRTQELYNDWERHQDIAVSLAEDIGRLSAERAPAALTAAE